MKQTINSYEFQNAFKQARPDNFSYDGLEALFEYLEQYETDTGEEIELDVIALCCDYSELSIDEVISQYTINDEIDLDDLDDDEKSSVSLNG